METPQFNLNSVNQQEVAQQYKNQTIDDILIQYENQYDEYLVLFPTRYTPQGKIIYISNKCFALDFVAPIDKNAVKIPYKVIDVRLIDKNNEYLAKLFSVFTSVMSYDKILLILIDSLDNNMKNYVLVHVNDEQNDDGSYVVQYPIEAIQKDKNASWLVP